MEDWVAYLELAFCTKYSLLNCLHTVRLKDYYILFNALPVLKKQFVVRAFSNYAPRFMNVLPQTLERLQFLNSLSPTAENPPVLGWVLNWCIDCFHYLFFLQYFFRLFFGVVGFFLRCLFDTITAPWAWLVHGRWALCMYTIIISIDQSLAGNSYRRTWIRVQQRGVT